MEVHSKIPSRYDMRNFTFAGKGLSHQALVSLNQAEVKDEDPEVVYMGTLLISDGSYRNDLYELGIIRNLWRNDYLRSISNLRAYFDLSDGFIVNSRRYSKAAATISFLLLLIAAVISEECFRGCTGISKTPPRCLGM